MVDAPPRVKSSEPREEGPKARRPRPNGGDIGGEMVFCKEKRAVWFQGCEQNEGREEQLDGKPTGESGPCLQSSKCKPLGVQNDVLKMGFR